MVDHKTLIAMRMEATEELLLKKIDKIIDEADEDGELSDEHVHELKDAWSALEHAHHVCREA